MKPVLLLILLTIMCLTFLSSGQEDSLLSELDDISPWLRILLLKEKRMEKVMKGPSYVDIKTTTKIVNKPITDNRPAATNNNNYNNEVSKTDMYLLNAIEKIAYKLETMEKRLKTTEELIFQIMEGSNIKRQDACPGNFTRVGRNCYHFSDRIYNWKSAASMCKSLGSNLLELESRDEYMEVVTFLQATRYLRGHEYWTGGLNPGLLWIWANSGRPVIEDSNGGNSHRPDQTVHGTGRCLRLAVNHSKLYEYQGADCGIRQRFICEHEENSTIRALQRIQKALVLKEQ